MIGIVGGAGPMAGSNLFQKIIEETHAGADQDHLPVLLWSAPEEIPDRTAFLEGKETINPGEALSRILGKLEDSGATVAGIACNTAHAPLIFDEIGSEMYKRKASLQLLNMIEETVSFIENYYPKGAKIGVLSTTGTWKTRLYIDPLREAGFSVLSPAAEEQALVHRALYDPDFGVKSTGTVISVRAKTILYGQAEQFIKQGAEAIILGCTEIPLVITEREYRGVPMVDTLRVFARALIKAYNPKKLRD